MSTNGHDGELKAAVRQVADNEPADAEPVRALRAVIADVAASQRPDSLADLRRLLDANEAIPPEHRGLVQYVLMEMLDQRELEISDDRRLIVRVEA